MSESMQDRLRLFACRLLERRGALVEWPPGADAGLAILPPAVMTLLHLPESLPLGLQVAGDGLAVNLATDFLERMEPLVAAEPCLGLFRGPALYLKQGGLDESLARSFTWPNARLKLHGAAAAQVQYHLWYWQVSILSEDRWEDVLAVTVNGSSRACLPLSDRQLLDHLEASDAIPVDQQRTYHPALRQAAALAESKAADFVARTEARLGRDRQRLHDYYGALSGEIQGKRLRGSPEEEEKRLAQGRAVALELQRKLAELEERYTLRVDLRPVALLCVDLTVLALQCEFFRRKERRTHVIYWNPLTKELEPMCCHVCGASIFTVVFRDPDVEPLCVSCARSSERARAGGPAGKSG